MCISLCEVGWFGKCALNYQYKFKLNWNSNFILAFCQHFKNVVSLCNLIVCVMSYHFSVFRCEAEGRLHHPGPWRSGTHDCGHADEEHDQGSQECSVVSPREDPNGCCILMGQRKMLQLHIPVQHLIFFFIFYLEQLDMLPSAALAHGLERW